MTSLEKIELSVGILAWKSGQTLVDTLMSYAQGEFLESVNDVTILFQEVSDDDRLTADFFGIPYIGLEENIGIGEGFIKLTEQAQTDNVLILEHDWQLVEDKETTIKRLQEGINLLNNGFHAVKYRHRRNPGYPLFTYKHHGKELEYYDETIGYSSPHLLDCIHWVHHPEVKFKEYISKSGEWFTTTSRYANWTNNPTIYKKQFYLDIVKPFAGKGAELEINISRWWAEQNFQVAQGEGLFTHEDSAKYANTPLYELWYCNFFNQQNDCANTNIDFGCDELVQKLKSLNKIPDHPVMLDIGANIGKFSEGFLKEYPNSTIYGFEPVSKYYEIAKHNLFDQYPNLYLFNLGISNKNEVNSIWICQDSNIGWNTMLKFDPHQPDDFTKNMHEELVQCTTLSDFCTENNIDVIDVIKIDVEGFEAKVLAGFFDFLKQMKKKPIFLIEVGWGVNHPQWNYCQDVYNQLFEIGYKQVTFDDRTRDIIFEPLS